MSFHPFFNLLKINLFLFLSIFFSCKEKSKDNPPAQKITISPGQMVLVCHEGNFRSGNAGIGLLNLATNQWDENAFQTFAGRALGDVCQSATLWNGEWWVVVNNSGKVEILKANDFTPQKTLEGLTSPRFLLPVSNTKAYLTDLYANKIWIIDGLSKSISGSIPFQGWGEEMVMQNGKVWVVNRKKNILYGIDFQTNLISDSITFSGNLSSIAQGPTGKIWVGFERGRGTDAGIALVNTGSLSLEKTWTNMEVGYPLSFQSSVTGDSLFFVKNQVYLLKSTDTEWPIADILDGKTGNFYGLGYDKNRKELWASDAKDYQQKSKLIRKNLSDGSIREYTGGIISSRFYFW